MEPRRFRIPVIMLTRLNVPNGVLHHPNGTDAEYLYGCYFPQTDLCISEMGHRSTGCPNYPDIEWLDDDNPNQRIPQPILSAGG
jgi:hypothetical protein